MKQKIYIEKGYTIPSLQRGIRIVEAIMGEENGLSALELEEEFGIPKRDILVKRVDKAKDAQEATKEEFANALEQFQSVVSFDGGDLQREYEQLNAAYESSAEKAAAVKSRNDDVENVAKALFKEWRAELKEYSNANLRASSQQQLAETETRYRQLMAAMRRAAAPVLLSPPWA